MISKELEWQEEGNWERKCSFGLVKVELPVGDPGGEPCSCSYAFEAQGRDGS